MRYVKKHIQYPLLLLFIFSCAHKSFAQDKRPIFLGLQPSYTAEPFYEKGELDINVVPLMIQIPIGKRIDFRITSIANYHIGGQNGFADVGAQMVLPIFIKKREKTKMIAHGFYVGPVMGLGTNLMNDHNTLVLAAEGGYLFPTKKSFSLSLGLQLGASYFDYFNQDNVWRNHFGVKINIGFWVNQGS